MASLALEMAVRRVGRNLSDPRGERAVPAEIGQAAVGAQEGVLQYVHDVGGVVEPGPHQMANQSAMASHQLLERRMIALTGSLDELRHRFGLRRFGSELGVVCLQTPKV